MILLIGMLHWGVYQRWCYIATLIKGCLLLQHFCVGLCWITTFEHGYATLWHLSELTSCQIDVFINSYFALHHPSCHVNVCHIATFIKCHVTLWFSLRVLLHCRVNEMRCHIVTSIKGCVTLQCSSRVMLHWVFFNLVHHNPHS